MAGEMGDEEKKVSLGLGCGWGRERCYPSILASEMAFRRWLLDLEFACDGS